MCFVDGEDQLLQRLAVAQLAGDGQCAIGGTAHRVAVTSFAPMVNAAMDSPIASGGAGRRRSCSRSTRCAAGSGSRRTAGRRPRRQRCPEGPVQHRCRGVDAFPVDRRRGDMSDVEESRGAVEVVAQPVAIDVGAAGQIAILGHGRTHRSRAGKGVRPMASRCSGGPAPSRVAMSPTARAPLGPPRRRRGPRVARRMARLRPSRHGDSRARSPGPSRRCRQGRREATSPTGPGSARRSAGSGPVGASGRRTVSPAARQATGCRPAGG